MENDILDSLNDLGYEGPLKDEVAFAKALEGGPKSLEFTKLIHILAEELKKLCHLEEAVSVMNDPDESSAFLLELSSFLKELGCPYKCLVIGHMSSRLQSKEDRLLLLDYMISELMAARMVRVDAPKEKQSAGMEIVMQESPTAKNLKEILISLKFNKPPPNITPEMLFSKLEAKLKDTIQKEGDKLVGKPLYNKAISEKDWKNLETSYSEMYEEYRLRRETLITRLECTIQSFEWSDRLKTKKDLIQSVYRPKREALKMKPDVKLSDFLAARTSRLHVEKTSSASVRKNTQSDVNKVIIGQVPDRGGRPNEQQPPPPEMPSWQQRSAPQGGGGRGGGDGGRGLKPVQLSTNHNVTTKHSKCPRGVTTTITTGTITVAVVTEAKTVAEAKIAAEAKITVEAKITGEVMIIEAILEDITKAMVAVAVATIKVATIAPGALIRDIVKVEAEAAEVATTKATKRSPTNNKATNLTKAISPVEGTRTNTMTATAGAEGEGTGGGVNRGEGGYLYIGSVFRFLGQFFQLITPFLCTSSVYFLI